MAKEDVNWWSVHFLKFRKYIWADVRNHMPAGIVIIRMNKTVQDYHSKKCNNVIITDRKLEKMSNFCDGFRILNVFSFCRIALEYIYKQSSSEVFSSLGWGRESEIELPITLFWDWLRTRLSIKKIPFFNFFFKNVLIHEILNFFRKYVFSKKLFFQNCFCLNKQKVICFQVKYMSKHNLEIYVET